MRVVGFDFETFPITPEEQCPPPVCLSLAWGLDVEGRRLPWWTHVHESAVVVQHDDGMGEALVPTFGIREVLRPLLADPGVLLVGANSTQFDFPVALAWLDVKEELFACLKAGRMVDIFTFERVASIGRLSNHVDPSLVDLCRAHKIPEPLKDETSVSYAPLWGRPLEEYSDRQIEYPLTDASSTRDVFERQRSRWLAKGFIQKADVDHMVRKLFALGLMRAWGMRTDPERIDLLRIAVAEHLEGLREIGLEAGFLRKDWTKDTKAIRAAVVEAYKPASPPMTKKSRDWKPSKRSPEYKPNVSIARATLEESGDALLASFAEYGEWSAVENKDLDLLEAGTRAGIHTKWGTAATTRATSSRPNVQNQRKDRPGRPSIRECFIARPGHVLNAIDHRGLELSTLAQVCVSKMHRFDLASKINAGIDLHSQMGAAMLGTSYQDFLDRLDRYDYSNTRNACKPYNFGCPGGAGAKTLRLVAKQQYHIDHTLEQAQEFVRVWKRTCPDGVAFLDWVNTLPEDGHGIVVTIPGSTIVRRGCTYCSACNTHFQGLGAWLWAHILWLVACEQHLGVRQTGPRKGQRSPLVWSHPWNYVHDEVIVETLEEARTEVDTRLHELVVEGAKPYLPDVAVTAESVCMRRWSKRAKSKYLEGEITIWDSQAA